MECVHVRSLTISVGAVDVVLHVPHDVFQKIIMMATPPRMETQPMALTTALAWIITSSLILDDGGV